MHTVLASRWGTRLVTSLDYDRMLELVRSLTLAWAWRDGDFFHYPGGSLSIGSPGSMSRRKMNKIRSDNLNRSKAEQEVILNSDIVRENLPAPGFEPMTYIHCSRAFLTGFRPPRAYPTRLGPSSSQNFGGFLADDIATFLAASKHTQSLYILKE